MKNQYVGDFNDFVKYAILRAVVGADLPVALCWMLTADDAPAEGQKLKYLRRPAEFRHLDPRLFDDLSVIVARGERTIQAVEDAQLFSDMVFYGRVLEDAPSARAVYFRDLWPGVPTASVVFFDPDNGFEVPSKPKARKGSSKYIYWDEVQECARRGHSVIVFQHFAREKREPYVARLLDRLTAETQLESAFALRSANVAFLFAAQATHAERLEAAGRHSATAWGGRLRFVPRPQPSAGPT
jgi:hypothetical protein